MQIGHDVEVGDQCAQLGRRAQNQLGARVDVEWLVKAVSMNAKVVVVAAALIEHDAVGHLIQVLRWQEILAQQPLGSGEGRIRQASQQAGDASLDLAVQGGANREIESIETGNVRQAEERDQLRPERVLRLTLDEGYRPWRRRLGPELDFRLQGGVEETLIDDAGVDQQAQ